MIFVVDKSKDYLIEMAKGLDDVKSDIHNSEEQRILNLMQIFILNGQTINHWINELYGCCNRTYKLKKSKKFPDKSSLEDWLWFDWEDCFENWLPGYLYLLAKKEGKEVLPEFDEDELYRFMREYHLWLAKELSIKGHVTSNEVKNKIFELLDIV